MGLACRGALDSVIIIAPRPGCHHLPYIHHTIPGHIALQKYRMQRNGPCIHHVTAGEGEVVGVPDCGPWDHPLKTQMRLIAPIVRHLFGRRIVFNALDDLLNIRNTIHRYAALKERGIFWHGMRVCDAPAHEREVFGFQ